MMPVNDAECEAAGIDPRAVASLVRRLERIGKDAKALGLTIFGGSGSGSLRFTDDAMKGNLIVGYMINGNWDGGDGAERPDENGLMRGETA